MRGYEPSQDEPITYWRGHPIHAAGLLVVAHVVTMLIGVILNASGSGGLLSMFVFQSASVLNGALWQPITYAFVNGVSIWFAIEMYLLWSFGSELEKFFGRKGFLQLYLVLLLVVPLAFTLYGLKAATIYAGSGALHFGIFVAFATLYPNVAMLFSITAKWVAVILIAVNSLSALSVQAWSSLLALWLTVGVAFVYTQWTRGVISLPTFRLPSRKPKLYVVRDEPPHLKPARKVITKGQVSMADVDTLLDKIAKSGIASLTASERERLERARAELMKNEGPGAR